MRRPVLRTGSLHFSLKVGDYRGLPVGVFHSCLGRHGTFCPLMPRPRPNEVPGKVSGGDREALVATSREAHASTETARWHVAGFMYGGQMQKGYLSIDSDRLQD